MHIQLLSHGPMGDLKLAIKNIVIKLLHNSIFHSSSTYILGWKGSNIHQIIVISILFRSLFLAKILDQRCLKWLHSDWLKLFSSWKGPITTRPFREVGCRDPCNSPCCHTLECPLLYRQTLGKNYKYSTNGFPKQWSVIGWNLLAREKDQSQRDRSGKSLVEMSKSLQQSLLSHFRKPTFISSHQREKKFQV